MGGHSTSATFLNPALMLSLIASAGAGSKHMAYGGKGNAPATRADLSMPAARSGFQNATQLLRPFRVNTEVAILQPTSSSPAFDASFLPSSNDYEIAGERAPSHIVSGDCGCASLIYMQCQAHTGDELLKHPIAGCAEHLNKACKDFVEEHWQSGSWRGNKFNQSDVLTCAKSQVKGAAPPAASPRRLSFSGSSTCHLSVFVYRGRLKGEFPCQVWELFLNFCSCRNACQCKT